MDKVTRDYLQDQIDKYAKERSRQKFLETINEEDPQQIQEEIINSSYRKLSQGLKGEERTGKINTLFQYD